MQGYTPDRKRWWRSGLRRENHGHGQENWDRVQPWRFLADLLLVAEDPTRNVGVLQDKNNLRAIMKDGKFHKAPIAA